MPAYPTVTVGLIRLNSTHLAVFPVKPTKSIATMTEPGGTAAPSGPAAMNIAIESALSNLKPLRDLAQNWDIDIASW